MPDKFIITCAIGVKNCPVILTGKSEGPITPKFLKEWCLDCVGCEIEIEGVE